MEPVGERLRQAREARGLSLRDIATSTKISVTALTALERGDVTRLPGGIFGRSFVRAYAAQVGLDADVIVRDFAAEVVEAERDSARKLRQATITADDREFAARQQRAMRLLRRGVAVVAILAGAVLVWGLWAWQRGGDADADGPPPLSVSRPVPPSVGRSDIELPAAPAAAPAPDAAGLSVRVAVSDACWIKVTADGLVVHEQLLAAGASREFSARRDLILDVGNAGVVSWSINGRTARAIGAAGVRQVVRLTLDNYEQYLAGG